MLTGEKEEKIMRCDMPIHVVIHVKEAARIGAVIKTLRKVEQNEGLCFEPAFIVKEAGEKSSKKARSEDECYGYGAD